MKILKGKSKRTLIFSVITVAVLIFALAANLLLSYFGGLNTLYLDLTERGIYSLSDKMVKECGFVDELADEDKRITVTFCTDPDYLTSADVTRATYFMALKLAQRFDKIDVEYANVAVDPLALSKYKVTSLTTFSPSDIIVSYGDRYRIVKADSFWENDYTFYNGEYVMATLMKSVTAVEQPAAYFTVGHGETVYDPTSPDSEASIKVAKLYGLLIAQGLRIGTVDLSKEDVPSDAAVVIINNPRVDFNHENDKLGSMKYESEVEKLDKYLINEQGALMVARDYDLGLDLSNLDTFLGEWGFEFGSSVVVDKESSIEGVETGIIASYETDETSVAYGMYKEFATISTSPKPVINNTGYIVPGFVEDGSGTEAGAGSVNRTYHTFLSTSEKANAYSYVDGVGYDNRTVIDKKGKMDIAALSAREMMDETSAEKTYSFVFAAASGDFFSSDTLGNAAYSNYDIVSSLTNTISRIDVYASLDLGGISLNSSSVGGKMIFEDTLYDYDYPVYDYSAQIELGTKWGLGTGEKVFYTILFALPAVAALAFGIYVCVKRRYM